MSSPLGKKVEVDAPVRYSKIKNPLRNGKRTRAVFSRHSELVKKAGHYVGIEPPKSPLR